MINNMKDQLLKEFNRLSSKAIVRFLVVGGVVTIFHNTVYHILMVQSSWSSFLCNLIAFLLSVNLSYLGHRLVTFSNPESLKTSSTLFKFSITALTNLTVSSIASFSLVDFYHLHHYWFIAFNVTVLPTFSFSLMKFWVFRK